MRTRSRNVVLLGAAALVAVSTLAACGIGGGRATEGEEQAVLQSYEVPPEYRQQLRVMLKSALYDSESPVGRVESGPGSTMLVVAPPRIQTGVRQMLNGGFDALPPQSPVKLTY